MLYNESTYNVLALVGNASKKVLIDCVKTCLNFCSVFGVTIV